MAAILENQQSAITPDHLQVFIIGASNKYASHDTRVFDLTYFLKVAEVKVQNGTNIGMFHYCLTWNILTLCEHVSRHHLPLNQILARSDFKYGWQVAILGKKSAITPELMAGSAPNCYHRYI
jgi:hypothetical protein